MTNQLVAHDRRRSFLASAASAGSGANAPIAPPVDLAASAKVTSGLAIRHILAPVDGSALAENAVPCLIAVAKAFGAQVTLLRVLDDLGTVNAPIDAVEWEIARAQALAYMSELDARLREHGLKPAVEIVPGRAVEQIGSYARNHDVDLIVLTSHGAGGLSTWNLGGTVQKIIATTHTSVLVVPARAHSGDPRSAGEDRGTHFRKMLVPLDCSLRAECILPAATELARAHGAELILAHVVPEPEMPRRMPLSNEDLELSQRVIERNRAEAERYLSEIQGRLAVGVHVEVRIVVSPHRMQALRALAQQEQVDLIVLSAHGSTGDATQHYGGVAAKFLYDGREPVIILQDLATLSQWRGVPDTAWQVGTPA